MKLSRTRTINATRQQDRVVCGYQLHEDNSNKVRYSDIRTGSGRQNILVLQHNLYLSLFGYFCTFHINKDVTESRNVT